MNFYNKAISLYSKITKKTILLVNKKHSTCYTPNGSVVKSPRHKEGDIIRGKRSEYVCYYNDLHNYDKAIEEATKSFILDKRS